MFHFLTGAGGGVCVESGSFPPVFGARNYGLCCFFLGGGRSTPRGLFACCLFIALRGCLFNVFSLILVLDVSAVLSAVIYSR